MLKVLLKGYSHVDIHTGDVQTRGQNHVQEHRTGNTMAIVNQMSVEAVPPETQETCVCGHIRMCECVVPRLRHEGTWRTLI